jgi:hypothetical protein
LRVIEIHVENRQRSLSQYRRWKGGPTEGIHDPPNDPTNAGVGVVVFVEREELVVGNLDIVIKEEQYLAAG